MNQQLAPSRVGALDGIRGVAIISVMGVHFFQDEGPIGLAIGVDIFFVLSGFLITKLMLKADDRDPHFDQAYFRNFYRRRFTRLMPALFGVTGVYLLLGPLLIDFPLKRVAAEVIASLTFTYPFLAAVGVDNGLGLLPMWSLSVEIWFYVIWPPVLGYLLRHSLPRRRIAIGLALSAVAFSCYGH
ncbi:MAG: acyltransferase [Microthrixaceae bacterium]